ncbi:MAG: mannosyltransferase family protein, partial [Ktedonobacterales bacterium]
MDVAVAPTTQPAERSVRAEEQPRLVSLRDHAVWRDAVVVWLGLHALLLALTYLGWLLPIAYDHTLPHATWARPYLPWAVNFDGTSYAAIARDGYVTLAQPAFYPLYPLLERGAAILTLGHLGVAGLLVSNACCLGAFVLLRVLAERELGRAAARRALLALAVFPTALFLTAAYAESLFLLLSLAAFLALRAHRWPLTGALIALAALTRPVGILLLAAVAAELWTTSPRLRHAVAHPLVFLSARRPLRATLSPSVPSVLRISPSASVIS